MQNPRMRDDRSSLLSPSSEDLPLLFEVARLLGRHAELADAMPPFVELVESRTGLRRGLAALSGEADEPLFVAAGAEVDETLLGRRVPRGPAADPKADPRVSLIARAIMEGHSLEGTGRLAVPIIVGGAASGAIAFDLGTAAAKRAMSLLLACAALVSDALVLRRRLRRDFETDRDGAPDAAVLTGAASALSEHAEADWDEAAWHPERIVGRSAPMRELFALMDRVAATETTVLVTGESGTGKELVARAVHERSRRARGPFVAVNCAALPESVIESELFGHERGAFTGAHERRRGRFELADGGTLFLDEIGELPLSVQVKLLRVLQEGEFQRVGASSTTRTDVRVIAATNRDLEADTASGHFRADLFWRLNVFPIRVPPLRERRSDIILLADHFAEKLALRAGKSIARISSPAIDLLMTYHWPGNVRELENCVERAVILSTDSVIHAYHLPPSLQSADSTGTGPAAGLDADLARLERELLVEALKMSRGNAAEAARMLGISERRMGLALTRHRLDWRQFRTRT